MCYAADKRSLRKPENVGTMASTSRSAVDQYGVTATRGFLPNRDPLVAFDPERHRPAVGSYLGELDAVGDTLPDLLAAGEIRSAVERIPEPPENLVDGLTDRELVRLALLSGFIASGYVNLRGAAEPDRLPASVAVPLYRASERLGRKPMLAYDHICLHNFRRRDRNEGFALENLEPVQQFTTYPDERWFVVVHVAIEAAAGPALVAAADAQKAARNGRPETVTDSLETIADSLVTQAEYMSRMLDGNDPAVFTTKFRPYYDGFDEVVYEGVDELGGEPQTTRGGSGAQSCVLPSLDGALGIEHSSTALLDKLLDMRTYMPADHRAVIDAFGDDIDLRRYVVETGDPDLEAAFNRSLDELGRFRRIHFAQVMRYIKAQTGETTGTGGTNYEQFLGKLEEETVEQKV